MLTFVFDRVGELTKFSTSAREFVQFNLNLKLINVSRGPLICSVQSELISHYV